MSVVVVFAFFGIELQGAQKARGVAVFERSVDARIRALRIKARGFAGQFLRRVRVGIGYDRIAVEGRQSPVHRRVRGQAGLDREDVRQQILVAFLQRVKARRGSQSGKVRRPYMGRDEEHVFVGFETDIQKVAAVQPQDGPTVGLQVANGAEAAVEPGYGFEGRQDDDVVDLAGLVALLVDGADFHREHEAHGAAAVLGQFLFHGGAAAGFELVQPLFGRFELLRQLGKPRWMRVIAGADYVNALERRPLVQIGGVERTAGRSRKTRVQVYVDCELHVWSLR